MTPDPQDVSKIGGNASFEVKKFIHHTATDEKGSLAGFARGVGDRFVLREISYIEKAEEPERMEGRTVIGITVGSDMVNFLGSMHGGCTAYLIDICTSLALTAFEMSEGGEPGLPSVSQALNIVYHSPAKLGDELRIVNTTIAVGSRAMSARCEIWNETHHRQVASGIHTKMRPSPPKLKAQL